MEDYCLFFCSYSTPNEYGTQGKRKKEREDEKKKGKDDYMMMIRKKRKRKLKKKESSDSKCFDDRNATYWLIFSLGEGHTGRCSCNDKLLNSETFLFQSN